jgi:hypothetical protein
MFYIYWIWMGMDNMGHEFGGYILIPVAEKNVNTEMQYLYMFHTRVIIFKTCSLQDIIQSSTGPCCISNSTKPPRQSFYWFHLKSSVIQSNFQFELSDCSNPSTGHVTQDFIMLSR